MYCSKVNKLALPYLKSAESGLVFLHFSDPDGAGHLHGWMSDEYLTAVGRADRCVAPGARRAARARQARPHAVVLTADHGGHDHDHALPIPPDTHIPWLAWGGAAKTGGRVRGVIYNTDTAATILLRAGSADAAGHRGQARAGSAARRPFTAATESDAAAAMRR